MRSTITKRCRKCRERKPISEFDTGHLGKPYQTCRDCRTAYVRRAPGHWGTVDSKICGGCGRRLAIEAFSWNAHGNGKNYRTSRCRDCKASACRAWNAKYSGTKLLNQNLLKSFGITLEEYNALVVAQCGLCAICRKPPENTDHRNRRLQVDHCHTCGAIRKLLCSTCNNGLGCFRDDPKLLAKAIEYLDSHFHLT